MFDPIIDFFNSLWELFVNFIQLILQWLTEIIMALFSVFIVVIKFMFWQVLDFGIALFSPWLMNLIDALPDFNIWTNTVVDYLSIVNQIYPVSEFIACVTGIFVFWLGTFCFKAIKKFVPGE